MDTQQIQYTVKNLFTPNQYIPKKVYTLVIEQDYDTMNPREWDNLGTFVGRHHRNYKIGDETAEPLEAMISALDDLGVLSESRLSRFNDTINGWRDDRDEILDLFNKHFIWHWVYMYEHGNVCYNVSGFSCQWDSGTAGIIYVSKKQARQEYSLKRITEKQADRIRSYLASEIETYSQWASGEAYGFRLFEHLEDQDYKEGEEVDSCWGFYGHDYKTNGILDHVIDPIHQVIEA